MSIHADSLAERGADVGNGGDVRLGERHTFQGWHDERFLLGSTLYGVGQDERVNLSPECARVGGEIRTFKGFENWASLSDTLFAEGSEARGFVLLAGFAAPLLGLLGEGGCTVILISEQRGQIEMLYAGLHSIWGKQKCLHIPRAIAYDKKFEILKACGHLPCVHPELLSADPAVSARFMDDATYQNTVLVSGSKNGISQEIGTRPRGTNKYDKRVLEVYLPQSDPQRDAELTSLYHNNFGTPGARFIRYVAANRGLLREKLRQYRASVGNALGDREAEKDLLNLVACVGLAAKVCGHLSLLHVAPERMVEWAKGALEGQRARDYKAVHEPELTLRDYLMDHLDAVMVVEGTATGPARERIILDTESPTVVRYEIVSRNLLIAVPDFIEWCGGRHQNGRRIIKELSASGVVVHPSTLNSLRSRHPRVTERPNPRVTTMELNPDHPLIAAHVQGFERGLRIEQTPEGPRVPGYRAPLPVKAYRKVHRRAVDFVEPE